MSFLLGRIMMSAQFFQRRVRGLWRSHAASRVAWIVQQQELMANVSKDKGDDS
jgi:hypothetical protein